MARRQYKTPFAATGDVVSVPDAVQPDGSVSLQQGYGFDYQRDPDTDPLAKVFPRDVHNGILNEITASIGEIQQNGYAIWVVEGAPYPINAVVRHNDANWQSNIATNNDEPGVGAGATSWKVAGASEDKFNAPIATVAAAGTIDLTAGAPNTSQLAISGTGVSINGFTVAANRFFVVKMTGATNTLVNSASLVTGRGSNIPVVAGDCFLMRSIASNTVEVVGGDFLIDRGVGYGQAYVDVTASRAGNTLYTNTTGRTITLIVTIRDSGEGSLSFEVGGVNIPIGNLGAGIFTYTLLVPAYSQYRVVSNGNIIVSWMELR